MGEINFAGVSVYDEKNKTHYIFDRNVDGFALSVNENRKTLHVSLTVIEKIIPTLYKHFVESQTDKELTINNNDTAVNKDVLSVIELFNKICVSLPKVLTATDSRKKMIENVIEQFNPDFKSVFEKIEKSDFLTGRSGQWNGCGFDWIFTPSNFVKIINGYYDNGLCSYTMYKLADELLRKNNE